MLFHNLLFKKVLGNIYECTYKGTRPKGNDKRFRRKYEGKRPQSRANTITVKQEKLMRATGERQWIAKRQD